ncbi:Hypothetical protein HVR_LOCUS935 [uncultured virus]|nr:Hypothetical protein HVR_LOCUS935 [uncultured virus]
MGTEISKEQLPVGVWTQDIEKYPGPYEFVAPCGYKCKISRNTYLCWCGYVKLPETHIFNNLDYDRRSRHGSRGYDNVNQYVIVHGDLTFANGNTFGFDCAHSFTDIIPGDAILGDTFINIIPETGRKYWTYDDVKRETEDLASQFKQYEKYNSIEELQNDKENN